MPCPCPSPAQLHHQAAACAGIIFRHGCIHSLDAVQVTALGQPQMLESLSVALSAGQPPCELPDRQLALMDATVARLSTLATAASKVRSSPCSAACLAGCEQNWQLWWPARTVALTSLLSRSQPASLRC